MLYYLYTT